MKRIPDDVLVAVEERAPRFAEAVHRIAGQRRQQISSDVDIAKDAVRVRLAAFRGDFALLYQCLWYADSKRVPIMFVANGERKLR